MNYFSVELVLKLDINQLQILKVLTLQKFVVLELV